MQHFLHYPSSISITGTSIGLGIPLSGTPNGSEVLTISPLSNAVFDLDGNPASQVKLLTQKVNT